MLKKYVLIQNNAPAHHGVVFYYSNNKFSDNHNLLDPHTNYHLYELSDECIKNGDLFIDLSEDLISSKLITSTCDMITSSSCLKVVESSNPLDGIETIDGEIISAFIEEANSNENYLSKFKLKSNV